MDAIVPSTEQDALFITTSQVITNDQSLGICDGNDDVQDCTMYSPKKS